VRDALDAGIAELDAGLGVETDYEVGVFPIDNDVALPGLYDSESP